MSESKFQYNRAKNWEIVLFATKDIVPNAFLLLMYFVSYLAVGYYGIMVSTIGLIVTGSRVLDGITDPVIGYLVDKTNGRFGRFRPMMVLGFVLCAISLFLMYFVAVGQSIWVFIAIYILYIIGYTFFVTASNGARSVLTNDPKQRANNGRWTGIFVVILSTLFSGVYTSMYLIPKYGSVSLEAMQEMCLTAIIISGIVTILSCIAIASKDTPEFYNATASKSVTWKDIFTTVKGNRPLQLMIVAASSDKLALLTTSQSAVGVMVWGIIVGNYAFQGQLTLWTLIPAILMIFYSGKIAGKIGFKKTTVYAAISAITVSLLMLVMFLTVPKQIGSNLLVTIPFVLLYVLKSGFTQVGTSCVPPMIADVADYEYYRTGKYIPGTVNAVYTFVDKIISSLAATIVSFLIGFAGYTTVMPQPKDTLTTAVFAVAMVIFLGLPILGWICTLIAMRHYNLNPEKMEEIQRANFERRAGKEVTVQDIREEHHKTKKAKGWGKPAVALLCAAMLLTGLLIGRGTAPTSSKESTASVMPSNEQAAPVQETGNTQADNTAAETAPTAQAASAAEENGVPQMALPDNILETLAEGHPRIHINAEGFQQLREKVKTDAQLQKWYDELKATGDAMVEKEFVAPEYVIYDENQLRNVEHGAARDRIITLCFLYQMEGDSKYADRAYMELEALSKWPDWNYMHFLDTAQISYAFGLAYDWLYDYFDFAQKKVVKSALMDKGLCPAAVIFNQWMTRENPHLIPRPIDFWAKADFNWNLVCNSGITVGALAIADEQPDLSNYILKNTINNLPYALVTYGPSGAWKEGVSYWGFATEYAVLGIDALQTALGTDFGLSEIKGFADTGLYPIQLTGPTGKAFNYSDATEERTGIPELFWFALKYNRPIVAQYWIDTITEPTAFDIIWYDSAVLAQKENADTSVYYPGETEVVVMRSAWEDNAWYAALKGGSNMVTHAHFDLGSFILDAEGERFAMDLGKDDYNAEGYFVGNRWNFYRIRPEGHNTLVFNPDETEGQLLKSAAKFIAYEAGNDAVFGVLDLSQTYEKDVESALRGIAMVGGNTVVISDEFKAKKPSDVYWFMHTKADIRISEDGKNATLTIGSSSIEAELLSEGAFTVREAAPFDSTPPAENGENKGVSKLTVELNGVTDSRIVVVFHPVGVSADTAGKYLNPLSDWSPDVAARKATLSGGKENPIKFMGHMETVLGTGDIVFDLKPDGTFVGNASVGAYEMDFSSGTWEYKDGAYVITDTNGRTDTSTLNADGKMAFIGVWDLNTMKNVQVEAVIQEDENAPGQTGGTAPAGGTAKPAKFMGHMETVLGTGDIVFDLKPDGTFVGNASVGAHEMDFSSGTWEYKDGAYVITDTNGRTDTSTLNADGKMAFIGVWDLNTMKNVQVEAVIQEE